MRMRTAFMGLALLVLLTSGCASMPAVPLQATPGDLEMLAGEWLGEYESAALGRHGSIEFRLKAGTDDAHGDVMMIPRGRQAPYQPAAYEAAHNPPSMPSSEMLKIRFVRASNGSVIGSLERYWDPDRNCYANTAFHGNIGRGVVKGTFKTTFECGEGAATGTWTASKKAAAPNAAWR